MVMFRATKSGPVELTAQEEAEKLAEQLEYQRAQKITELKDAYNTAIHADITHNTKTYEADENLLNVISRFSSLNAVPAGMYIEAKNGEQIAMNLAGLRAFGMAIAERGLASHQNLTAKKAEVNAATTAAEIDSVVY